MSELLIILVLKSKVNFTTNKQKIINDIIDILYHIFEPDSLAFKKASNEREDRARRGV